MDRVLPVLLMLGACAVWWTRPVVGAVREWRRERNRYRWNRRDEWRRAMDALGDGHGRQ